MPVWLPLYDARNIFISELVARSEHSDADVSTESASKGQPLKNHYID